MDNFKEVYLFGRMYNYFSFQNLRSVAFYVEGVIVTTRYRVERCVWFIYSHSKTAAYENLVVPHRFYANWRVSLSS